MISAAKVSDEDARRFARSARVALELAAGLPEWCAASLICSAECCALMWRRKGRGSLRSSVCSAVGRPARGEVFFGGVPLPSLEPRARARRIAYVPQASASVFPLTALEVVLMGRSPYTSRFRFENERDLGVARDALAAVDAAHLAARSVTELSGGERQLVALARALAQEPECLCWMRPRRR